jgi:UDP-N-acetylmuramoyl-L-alanyl-D-glutamate--2,6-diaminopimelate ligase
MEWKMKLKTLLSEIKNIEVKGSQNIEITGITTDSKTAFSGSLFIARKGNNFDGNDFIEEAVLAGAKAVVCDLYNPFLKDVTQIITPDANALEADLASVFYQSPSSRLKMIGITGTKGKTTTSYLIKYLLDQHEMPCGLLGTIETIIQDKKIPSKLTTASSVVIQKNLKEMLIENCKACVMEVSSHALDQNRVKNILFDRVILTNIASDHLDYHQTHEHYLSSKQKLFLSHFLKENAISIVNHDDFHVEKFKTKNTITYSIDHDGDLIAHSIEYSLEGTSFVVEYENLTEKIFIPLIGRFNVYNTLAAMGVALSFGISLDKIQKALASFPQVPGRMQKVLETKDIHIFVDYAHTEDSLKNVLSTLQAFKRGRIITVFGCGGNRDRTKRPKMAKVAEDLSDAVIVTSDNPRNEDPEVIIQEILAGFQQSDYVVEIDRKNAIEKAIGMAQSGDTILIAGKGHEKIQIIKGISHPFDDVLIAQEIANKHIK